MGKLIHDYAKQKRIKMSDLADDVGLARRALYNVFEREGLNSTQIQKFSDVLDHDFFQYLTNKEETNAVAEDQPEYKKTKVPELVIRIELVDDEGNLTVDNDFMKFLDQFAKHYKKKPKSKPSKKK